MSHKSGAQALHWLILCKDSWLQPPSWLCDWTRPGHCPRSPHTGGSEHFQGMDEDVPECLCKRCWKGVGGTAPTVRMVDGIMTLIHRYSPSLLPIPCSSELGPPGMSDGLKEFSCCIVETELCGGPFVSATNEVEIYGSAAQQLPWIAPTYFVCLRTRFNRA